MNKEIFAERKIWKRGVDIHVVERRNDGLTAVLRPGIFETIAEGEYVGEPSLHMQDEEAQRLMDELWHCGLRPSEGTGSAGSLAATERHLADMQRITRGVLKKYGVET